MNYNKGKIMFEEVKKTISYRASTSNVDVLEKISKELKEDGLRVNKSKIIDNLLFKLREEGVLNNKSSLSNYLNETKLF